MSSTGAYLFYKNDLRTLVQRNIEIKEVKFKHFAHQKYAFGRKSVNSKERILIKLYF